MIKATAIVVGLALPLALAGCQNEPEEAPDIEETIPVDAEAQADPEQEPEATPETNPEPQTEPSEMPSTMESGSNPPGMTAPPKGSKVQPAD